MTDIPYSYEIIAVDPDAKCMEIVYTSPGRQTMHIGARMPYEGESLRDIVMMYSPVVYWREQDTPVVPVEPGTSGEITPPAPEPMTLDRAKREKLAEIAAWRYATECAGVRVNGVDFETDRQAQAQLTSAYSTITGGFATSIDWKAADGTFVTLDQATIVPVIEAVLSHVQAAFSAEKALGERVAVCTTIEEVQAIQVF